MNYLAHLYLAQRNPHSLVGNLMGDFIRGINVSELPPVIARGVQNHKAVDRFTDSHTILRSLKANFSTQRRRFAGIIIDVVFDHFLIKHWENYSSENLDDFTAYCYNSLASLHEVMPTRMQQKVDWMIRCDLLNSYAGLNGVSNALNGMSRRIRFENRLAGAIEEVENHYAALEQGFLAFFSQLCAHIRAENIEEVDDGSQNLTDHSLVYHHPLRRIYRTS
ncbi:MAG: ACP phosphodiesterase [Gammaproteobacteria bacterium]